MRALVCLRRLFAASFLGLSVVLLNAISVQRTYPQPIPMETIAVIREYIATVDQFIFDGDANALDAHLKRLGGNLDLWPHPAASAFEPIAALAFRATYPSLHLSLTHIRRIDDLIAFSTHATGNVGGLPDWLVSSDPALPTDREELARVADGRIELSGTTSSPSLSAYPLPAAGAALLLRAPARLIASQFTLTQSNRGDRYLTVTGPGIVAPELESLSVEGDGQLLILPREAVHWKQLPAGEKTIVAPADLLLIPYGTAILTMTGEATAEFAMVSVVPLEPSESAGAALDGGHGEFDLNETLLHASATPTSTWFGTVSAAGTSGEIPAGAMTLDAAWLLLPPGQRAIIRNPAMSIAIEIGSESSRSAGEDSLLELRITDTTPVLFFVVRLCPR